VNAEQSRVPGISASSFLELKQIACSRYSPMLAVSTNAGCSSGVCSRPMCCCTWPQPHRCEDTLRIGFGRFNTLAQVEIAAGLLRPPPSRFAKGFGGYRGG